MKWREEVIGDARLILGDCLEVMPTLDRTFSVVTDPPYGMGWDTDSTRFTGGQRKPGVGRSDWGSVLQDDRPFDPSPWLQFAGCVLWGANHYAQRLPLGSTLVWLKKPPHLYGTFLSDAEIGWRKGGYGVYCHFKQFPPPVRMLESLDGRATHPTQKPIALMAWCLGMVDGPILDPFMGSGTTGIAALQARRVFVGIEKDPAHFETACRRIKAAYRQRDLFRDEPQAPKPVQQSLLGDAA